jgi:hypothetical protein
VFTRKVAVNSPAGTVMDDGTDAFVELLDNCTTRPPVGA